MQRPVTALLPHHELLAKTSREAAARPPLASPFSILPGPQHPSDRVEVRRQIRRQCDCALDDGGCGGDSAPMSEDTQGPDVSQRQAHAEATYERLFGPDDLDTPDNDPKLMRICADSSSETSSTPAS